MSTPMVLSLGELLWDMLPTGKRAGGAPVNFIYHAAMNGAGGYAISAVGRDALGDELVRATDKAGIHAKLQRNDWPTGTVKVSLKEGIPTYTVVNDVAWDHLELTDELVAEVQRADAVCFGTLGLRSQQSRDTILALLDHARSDAMKFFDINIRGEFYSKRLIGELLEAATVFKLNDDELLLLRQMFAIPREADDDRACQWLLERFDLDYVILTAGAKFSTILSQHGEHSTLATPHVQVVDTVGAGDSFSGSFAASMLRGATMAQAHRVAVNTAAFVCTQEGAWPRYPEHITDYLAQMEQTTQMNTSPAATQGAHG